MSLAKTPREKKSAPPQPPAARAHEPNPPAAAATESLAFRFATQIERQPGEPLDPEVRGQMEKGLGHPFSQVRIHTDLAAHELASSMSARAFTAGDHIAFESGRYRTNDFGGLSLLAHELAHVAQQSDGTASPGANAQSGSPQSSGLEVDANRAAAGALMTATPYGPGMPKTTGPLAPLMSGPALRTAPGIQKSDTPTPLTKLDPTYADTPKAAAAPEQDWFDRTISFDGDGDQVPELLVRFKVLRKDGKDAKLRIELSSNPDTVGTKQGTKPGTDAFECDIPAGLRLVPSPTHVQVTDGFTQTIFEFDYTMTGGTKWSVAFMPPTVDASGAVYGGEVWFPGPNGELQEAEHHDFIIPTAKTAVHNVFRPADPTSAGPGLWTLDMDVGAYADQFRLTFQQPTPGSSTLEISVVALQEGEPVAWGSPLVTTLGTPLNVKIVASSGAGLTLSLDGSGTPDLEVYDRLDAEPDYTSSFQMKQVAKFRSHWITLARSPRFLGTHTERFSVKNGLFEPIIYGGPSDFKAASATAAATELSEQAKSGTYADQISALEQLRIQARKKAANDNLIRFETASAWDALSRDITAHRTNGKSDTVCRTEDTIRNSAAAGARKLAQELALEPGLADAFEVESGGDADSGLSFSENQYTGAEKSHSLFGSSTIERPTLERLADQISASLWPVAYVLYDQAAGEFDKWIAKRLKDKGRLDEAKNLEGAVELNDSLEKLGTKTGVTPVYAVFHASDDFQKMHRVQDVPLRMYYYREDHNWWLNDVSRPDNQFNDHFKDSGEDVPPHELFLELNSKKHFPKGYVQYRFSSIDPNTKAEKGRTGRVECTADWEWSDVLGWIAAGVAAVGFIALTMGAGSVVVTGIFVVSGVAGAASGVLDLADAYKHGNMQPERIALDAAMIIGSLAGAGAGIAAEINGAKAAVAAGREVSSTVQMLAQWEGAGRLFVPLTAAATTADVYQFISFAREVPDALNAIDASGGSDSDRLRAKVVLLAQLGAMGALTIMSVKGAFHGAFKGRPPKIKLDVVEGVPWISLAHDVKPGEYETALNSALSADAKKALGTVPVSTVDKAEMIRLTGKDSGQAVVLMEGGKPKVVVLEGAHPSVLNEELPHLEQLADKKLGKLAASLDEAKLAQWSKLGNKEKLQLTRNQLTLEIDAQQRTIKAMQQKIDTEMAGGALKPGTPEADALFRQADDLYQNLEHLIAKDTALTGLQKELAATKTIGDTSALQDAPRLFSKTTTTGFDLQANWRTLNKEDFITAYKAKYPDTSLSDKQLGERWDMGKRLNPTSWHLGAAERQPAPTPDIRAEYKKPDFEIHQPGTKDVPLTAKDQSEWDALIANRDKWKAERAKQEGKAVPDEAALRTARYELNEASRKIGEMAGRQYVKGRWPDAELIYPKGGGSRSGDFDLVYRVKKTDGTFEYIVVEAKGGSADLGSRMASTPKGMERAEQGTRPYYESVRDNMAGGSLGPEAKAAGEALQQAKAADVNYIVVKAPFEAGDKTVIKAIKTNDFKM
jgi:hypothetical protein